MLPLYLDDDPDWKADHAPRGDYSTGQVAYTGPTLPVHDDAALMQARRDAGWLTTPPPTYAEWVNETPPEDFGAGPQAYQSPYC